MALLQNSAASIPASAPRFNKPASFTFRSYKFVLRPRLYCSEPARAHPKGFKSQDYTHCPQQVTSHFMSWRPLFTPGAQERFQVFFFFSGCLALGGWWNRLDLPPPPLEDRPHFARSASGPLQLSGLTAEKEIWLILWFQSEMSSCVCCWWWWCLPSKNCLPTRHLQSFSK